MWYNGYKNHVEYYSGGVFMKSKKEIKDTAVVEENVKKYVLAGCMPKQDGKFYRSNIIGPLLLTLLGGVYPGIVLKGGYLFITGLLLLLNILSIWKIYSFTAGGYTYKGCLTLNCILYTAWVLEFSLLELIYFSMLKGFHISVLLLYVPVILLPLIMGFNAHRNMYKPRKSTSKVVVGAAVGTIGVSCGLLGRQIAKTYFSDVDQTTAIIIVLVCFVIVSTVMSVGLLNIQRLYYADKYKITFETETD
jgi:hypothetical protein